MVELADTAVLEAADESRESSSLSWGTINYRRAKWQQIQVLTLARQLKN